VDSAKSLCLEGGKDFLLKGGDCPLAITKQRKEEMLAQYQEWIGKSQAVIVMEYTGAKMKEMDAIRSKIRDAGGEFHVMKNTLAKRAFEGSGMTVPAGMLEKSSAVSFAFSDVAGVAKALNEAVKGMDFVKVKGGFMGPQALSTIQVKALADLPTLPVARARLLGMLQAPAGQLVRTIAEPARSLAAVFKAYADKPVAA
jgi:large subunit ribosomal protein L10